MIQHHRIIPKKKRSWIYSPIITVVLVIGMIWSTRVVMGIYMKNREAVALKSQSSQELLQLKEKEAQLRGKIEFLSTDRGLEEEVRNRYRAVKPGEQLVIIVDDPESTNQADQVENKKFWQKVKHFVGF